MRPINNASEFGWLERGFEPISLDVLNSKAEMLSRIDNKYVIDRQALQAILPALARDFDILEIENCRAFVYETSYFDDRNHSAYYEHHQGLRKGFKVRVRHYTDTDACFLEVKVKGKRGRTLKFRQPYEVAMMQELDQQARSFARDTYAQHYGKPFNYDLRQALNIRYKRTTLAAKSGGERMTIDSAMEFRNADRSYCASSDVFIVETKSALGRGIADLLLRRAHSRPTKKCSKYCIGMAVLGEVSRWNRFMPTMRLLQMVNGNKLIGSVPHRLAA
ncbi:MAG: polyphosphate polymerase domain-containing protein [Albidovulum sp.]